MREFVEAGTSVKLNLGCGDDVKDGYINVDIRPTRPNVMVADLSTFPWPFADESAEEILMLDFLEHFPYRQTEKILLECFRVMKPDGRVIIQVPDAEHLLYAMAKDQDYLCNRCGRRNDVERFDCEGCGQSFDDCAEAAMRRLFGGQDYPGNWHQAAFTRMSLILKARNSGLNYQEELEEKHQYENWNFKMNFAKGEIW